MLETDNAFRGISHPKKRAFLAAFSRCGSRSRAAHRAKVDRRTHYNWLRDDPEYAKAFDQAMGEAADALEDAMTDFAFDGNVTAGIFLLKGLKPEKFTDTQSHRFVNKEGEDRKLDIESVRAFMQSS